MSMIVCIVGPDGVGKSTMVKKIIHGSQENIFINKHWRPGYLPRQKKVIDKKMRKNIDCSG